MSFPAPRTSWSLPPVGRLAVRQPAPAVLAVRQQRLDCLPPAAVGHLQTETEVRELVEAAAVEEPADMLTVEQSAAEPEALAVPMAAGEAVPVGQARTRLTAALVAQQVPTAEAVEAAGAVTPLLYLRLEPPVVPGAITVRPVELAVMARQVQALQAAIPVFRFSLFGLVACLLRLQLIPSGSPKRLAVPEVVAPPKTGLPVAAEAVAPGHRAQVEPAETGPPTVHWPMVEAAEAVPACTPAVVSVERHGHRHRTRLTEAAVAAEAACFAMVKPAASHPQITCPPAVAAAACFGAAAAMAEAKAKPRQPAIPALY